MCYNKHVPVHYISNIDNIMTNKKILLFIPFLAILMSIFFFIKYTPKQTEPSISKSSTQVSSSDITFMIGSGAHLEKYDFLSNLAKEKLGISITYEHRPIGESGDQLIKEKLAAGEMADIFVYNTGSLLAALHPDEYFLDLSKETYIDKLDKDFRDSVTFNDGIYGIPSGYCNYAGVVLYNQKIYAKYNLSPPKTWTDFIHNCNILQNNGETALLGGFAEKWSSQVPVLADYYNVQLQVPDFARELTEGHIHYATTPSAISSLEKFEELVPYYNKDFQIINCKTAIRRLAESQGAHMIITIDTALPYLSQQEVNEIGAFGIPNNDASSQGITVWPASAICINKNSTKLKEIRQLIKLYMEDDTIRQYFKDFSPDGFLAVKLPIDITQNNSILKDVQKYIDEKKYCIALEYQTTIKGSGCEDITFKLATGKIDSLTAAKEYDNICKKQAEIQHLNWN